MSDVQQLDPSAFARPKPAWFLVINGGLAGLAVTAFHEPTYDQVKEMLPLPPRAKLQRLALGSLALHVAESALGRRMAKARGLDRRAVRRWTRQTFLVGFPSLLLLRKVPKR